MIFALLFVVGRSADDFYWPLRLPQHDADYRSAPSSWVFRVPATAHLLARSFYWPGIRAGHTNADMMGIGIVEMSAMPLGLASHFIIEFEFALQGGGRRC